jgi:hypothetical protein
MDLLPAFLMLMDMMLSLLWYARFQKWPISFHAIQCLTLDNRRSSFWIMRVVFMDDLDFYSVTVTQGILVIFFLPHVRVENHSLP